MSDRNKLSTSWSHCVVFTQRHWEKALLYIFMVPCCTNNSRNTHNNSGKPTVYLFLLIFYTDYPFLSICVTSTANPKSLLKRAPKKAETYVQGCVPRYLCTREYVATFIFFFVFIHIPLLNSTQHGQMRSHLTIGKTPVQEVGLEYQCVLHDLLWSLKFILVHSILQND